jgi:hypothetical protein
MIQSLHRVLAQTDNQIKIVPGDGPVALVPNCKITVTCW